MKMVARRGASVVVYDQAGPLCQVGPFDLGIFTSVESDDFDLSASRPPIEEERGAVDLEPIIEGEASLISERSPEAPGSDAGLAAKGNQWSKTRIELALADSRETPIARLEMVEPDRMKEEQALIAPDQNHEERPELD